MCVIDTLNSLTLSPLQTYKYTYIHKHILALHRKKKNKEWLRCGDRFSQNKYYLTMVSILLFFLLEM